MKKDKILRVIKDGLNQIDNYNVVDLPSVDPKKKVHFMLFINDENDKQLNYKITVEKITIPKTKKK